MQTASTVLVVDDDAEIREFLEDMLSMQGYTVVTVATQQEAEDARQHLGAASIGLVICDVHLTNDLDALEGYWLCEHWKAVDPLLPVVLISGDLGMKGLPAVQIGDVHFVSKPFAAEEFLMTVRRIFPVQ